MPNRQPVDHHRIRQIKGSFSWIEHRFVHDGFLEQLSAAELLVYYFLVTVGDKNGVSFYSYEKICHLLKMTVDTYVQARNRLIERELIAYENDVFQVLPLPRRAGSKKIASPICNPPPRRNPQRDPEFQSFAELIKHVKEIL